MATTPPLNQQKSATSDFQLPPMPKLAGLIQQYGLQQGAQKFDEQMENWRRALVRNAGETFQGK